MTLLNKDRRATPYFDAVELRGLIKRLNLVLLIDAIVIELIEQRLLLPYKIRA